MKQSHALWGHRRRAGHGGEVWQNVVHWRREWQTTSIFLPWEPHEQYEKANTPSSTQLDTDKMELNLSLLSSSLPSPQEAPLLQCSPGLLMRAGQTGPPQGRIWASTHVWPWCCVQSWRVWVCVYFCSQECPEQEPAFVDSSVVLEGFPGGASGKEPAFHCRRQKRWGFGPWVKKIPWRRAWHPTPVFLPGESHGQRSLAGYSPWGRTE